MTVRINKQKINLREKLTEFEDKVNFDEVVRGLGEYDGNVGISVEDPGGKLHVSNGLKELDGTVSIIAGTVNVTGIATSFKTELIQGDRIIIGSQICIVQSVTNDTALTLKQDHVNGASNVKAYTEKDGLIVASDGKVGIGPGDPKYKLDIKSTSETDNTLIALRNTSDGDAGILFDASNGDFIGSDYWWIGQKNNLDFSIEGRSNAGDLIISDTTLKFGSNQGSIGRIVFPNMTDTERDAISDPVSGEMIFNTTTNTFQGYTGAAPWVDLH